MLSLGSYVRCKSSIAPDMHAEADPFPFSDIDEHDALAESQVKN